MIKKLDSQTFYIWSGRLSFWVVAIVFLVAAVPKVSAPADFAQVISMYGLLPGVLVYPTAVVLPLVELVTAVGLVFFRRWALLLAAAQLLMFIGVLLYGIHLGLDIDCGCFGPEDPEHDAVSGLRTALVRDILFFMLVVYSWLMIKKNYPQKSKENGT